MIVGVAGDPRSRLGCAKTIFAVWLANVVHEQYKMPICANLHLFKTEYSFLENYDDLLDLRNAIIILDDIYRIFLGRKNAIKRIVQLFAGTSRKHGNYIIYTSSRMVDNVEKNLRLHTNIFVLPSFDIRNDIVKIRTLDSMEREIRGVFPAYLPANIVREVYTRYDTDENVNIWNI